MISRLRDWLRHGLWHEDLRHASRERAFRVGAVRVLVHGAQSFRRNLVGIQAAGLTLFTLFALVPMMWFGFGVAKSLGFGDKLELWLAENSEGLPSNLQDVIHEFQSMVNRVDFQLLGLWGIAILGYSGYALLTKAERAFNHVWQAPRRSWYKRMGAFVAVVVLVPILILVSTLVESVFQKGLREHVPWLLGLFDARMVFTPGMVLWVALTLLYKLLPSASVQWRAAATAGVITAITLLLLNRFYVEAQVGLALANQLYAALAALPMLLVYLTLFWTVVLAGVQVSFAVQNIHALRPTVDVPAADYRLRCRLALALVGEAYRSQREGEGSVDLTEFTQQIGAPYEWVSSTAGRLLAAGVLRSGDAEGDAEAGGVLTPGHAAISAWDVLQAVVESGPSSGESPTLTLPEELADRLAQAETAVRSILESSLLGSRVESAVINPPPLP